MLVEELEAELEASWDRETLEAYADTLEAQGDPRGALIALALAGTPDAPRIRERRAALVENWLAGFAGEPDGFVDGNTGFIVARFRTALGAEAFMRSHVARYLRRVYIDARAAASAILDVLATERHPWCIELEIQIDYADWGGPAIPRDVIARLGGAMPNLTTLRLYRARVDAVPASVKKLELHFTLGAGTMPHVEELVLYGLLTEPPEQLAECVARFPALRRLDLGDNEPRLAQVFALLDAAHLDHVRVLRLPSLRTQADGDRVRALLRRLPQIEIELGRVHRPLRALVPDDPRVRIPMPVPCPPNEDFTYDDILRVTMPGGHAHDLLVRVLAYNTETFFGEFTDEQQAALSAFWERFPAYGAAIGFPGAAMLRVAETMMQTDCDSMLGISGWDELERELKQKQSCSVQIARL